MQQPAEPTKGGKMKFISQVFGPILTLDYISTYTHNILQTKKFLSLVLECYGEGEGEKGIPI